MKKIGFLYLSFVLYLFGACGDCPIGTYRYLVDSEVRTFGYKDGSQTGSLRIWDAQQSVDEVWSNWLALNNMTTIQCLWSPILIITTIKTGSELYRDEFIYGTNSTSIVYTHYQIQTKNSYACAVNPTCDTNQTLDTSFNPPICVTKCDANQTLDTSFDPPKCVDNPPTCTDPDTDFPTLKTHESVIYAPWTLPSKLDKQCTGVQGNVQQSKVDCIDTYRCMCPYTPYPKMADNEEVFFTWSANGGVDKSSLCQAFKGHVQQERLACATNYRCVGLTENKPKICDESINSYVSPRDGTFHEDIALDGVDFGLHYDSSEWNSTSVAHGWSISAHARLEGDRLHYGSGSMRVVDVSTVENGLTVVLSDSNEMLFDVDGKIQSIRDLYTKETKTTFSYDLVGNLVTLSDIYGEISTIERDGNGTVTAIVAPTGQRTLLSIDVNSDLVEVQYEDTSSYAFEYQRHLMTVETEPNGNRFLHFFDDAGNVVKVIDAEQGEWLFGSATADTYGSHTVTRASGDVIVYKNHFLENNTTLRSEKLLPTGDVVEYINSIDDSSSSVRSCGMLTQSLYQTNANGTLYKDPYTQRRVLESQSVRTPSGLSRLSTFTTQYFYLQDGTLTHIDKKNITSAKTALQRKNLRLHRDVSISPLGKRSVLQYDKQMKNLLWTISYGLHKTNYTYDTQGRVTQSQTGNRVTHYTYNPRGNLQSITDPLGRTTTYTYDSRDRVIQTTYADGHSMYYSYDANGNMSMLTTPTPSDHTFSYNGVNKRTSHDSPLGLSTTYIYDKQRRVIEISKPSGASISTNYIDGRVESLTTPEGTTSYTYACQSNLSNITKDMESLDFTYDGTLLTSMIQSGALNETLTFSYNNDFLVSSMTYAGVSTNYSYNKDSELTQAGDFSINRVLNATLSQTLTDGTYTQVRDYNGYGEVASEDDGLFGYTLTRNANGQIVKKVERLNSNEVTYNYRYDQRARLIQVMKNGKEVESYTYDANGNRLQAKVYNQTTTASYTLDDNLIVYGDNSYLYDDDGYLIEKTTPNGVNTYTYNTLGALTQATVQTTPLNASWHVYDKTPAGASISNVYDSQKQSNVIAFHGSGISNGYRLGYSGDTNVNAWKSTDDIIQWRMNFAENYTVFISVMTTKGHRYLYYTAADTNLGLRPNGNFIHLGLGRISRNGTWQTFTRDLKEDLKAYEPDNTLLSVNGFLVRGSGRVDDIKLIQGNKTIYDDAEDGTLKTWHVYDKTPAGASISNVYDSQKQSNVIAFHGSGISNGYRLGYSGDTNVNAWKSTDDIIQWRMNFAENYTVYISVMTTKGHRYLYYTAADTNLGLRPSGNVIHLGLGRISKNGTWQTFTRDLKEDLKTYEPDNTLLSVNGFLVRGSGSVDDIAMISSVNETIKDDAESTQTINITYQQNANNQRVAKLINGQVVEKYLWADLTTLLAIYDSNDNLVQRFEYADGRMPVAMTMNGQKYYLHYDQVGSLRAISRVLSPDNTFEVVKEITYDTFGNILSDTNPSLKVPFGFAGGLYDSDTKLTRFGYRDYDAYTGKWTAKDPIGFGGGDSNLYGYVLGNPVNFVDPEGLAEEIIPVEPIELHEDGDGFDKPWPDAPHTRPDDSPDAALNKHKRWRKCLTIYCKKEMKKNEKNEKPWDQDQHQNFCDITYGQ